MSRKEGKALIGAGFGSTASAGGPPPLVSASSRSGAPVGGGYGSDDDDTILSDPSSRRRSNFGGAGRGLANCFSMMCCTFPGLINQKGIFPLAFHRTHEGGPRHQHYKATMIFFTAASFLALAITTGVLWNKEHQNEHDWFQNLDEAFHKMAAIVTFAAIDAAVSGVVATAWHFGSKAMTNRTLLRDAAREEPEADIRMTTTRGGRDVTETSGLINSTTGHAANFHVARLCFPFDTKRAFGWTFGVAAFATTMALLIKPELFTSVSDSDFAHYGAVVTAATAGALATGGLFTGAHFLGAKAHDAVDRCRGEDDYSSVGGFDRV